MRTQNCKQHRSEFSSQIWTLFNQTKVELHEQYAQQKELLIDAVEAKVNDYLLAEINLIR